MLKPLMFAVIICASLLSGTSVPAVAECDSAWRAKCGRLPYRQRMRCLELCSQKPPNNAGNEGSHGKAEIKKKNVPAVKPND